jgi:pantoate--beta-alanine ligase
VQPQKAYFGQKDAQQSIVIRRMAQDLDFPVEIVVCPTIRETDGLAMSSRNVYLDPSERKAAPVLYRALSAARLAFEAGERGANELRQIMQAVIEKEPLAKLQYLSCADANTLQEIEGEITSQALLSMAVFIGQTRLIDNLQLDAENRAAR